MEMTDLDRNHQENIQSKVLTYESQTTTEQQTRKQPFPLFL